MLYLSGVMHDIPGVGFMQQPASANRVPTKMPWALDNGCFAGTFHAERFMRMVSPTALFCTLPDVVGDWDATLARSRPWIDPIRKAGGKVAIVLQDGCTPETVLWDEVDAIFVGGTTAWKLGSSVPSLIAHGRRRGLHCHMGRVNSYRRLRLAAVLGCHSVDGTFLARAPDQNAPRLVSWLARLSKSPMLDLARNT